MTRTMLRWLWLPVLFGCGAAQGSDLASALPAPPDGWKFQEKARQAKLGEAGVHAWTVYQPAAAGDFEKAEVIISRKGKDTSAEAQKKLRRLESFKGGFMEQ